MGTPWHNLITWMGSQLVIHATHSQSSSGDLGAKAGRGGAQGAVYGST